MAAFGKASQSCQTGQLARIMRPLQLNWIFWLKHRTKESKQEFLFRFKSVWNWPILLSKVKWSSPSLQGQDTQRLFRVIRLLLSFFWHRRKDFSTGSLIISEFILNHILHWFSWGIMLPYGRKSVSPNGHIDTIFLRACSDTYSRLRLFSRYRRKRIMLVLDSPCQRESKTIQISDCYANVKQPKSQSLLMGKSTTHQTEILSRLIVTKGRNFFGVLYQN